MSGRSKSARRVAIVTGTRADYGLLKPVIEQIRDHADLQLQLIATGMHLRPLFGETVREIEADGFELHARVAIADEGDDHLGAARTIGSGVSGLADAFAELDPDIVLVLGDRVEAFAAAIAAAAMNRVVAHIHGGEVTRGGLDESMRHAITKLAHVHFTATEQSRDRVVSMGEEAERVTNVGAPGLDTILHAVPASRDAVEATLGAELDHPLAVLLQHPVSITADAGGAEIQESIEALLGLGMFSVCVYPNSDPGGQRMIGVIETYRDRPGFCIVPNLPRHIYLGLLSLADVLVGNSSGGIIEAPSFHLPAINIGSRQDGRERASNVIDVEPQRELIAGAIRYSLEDESFRDALESCQNPYGNGSAAPKIAAVLASVPLVPEFLQKQLAY